MDLVTCLTGVRKNLKKKEKIKQTNFQASHTGRLTEPDHTHLGIEKSTHPNVLAICEPALIHY